MKHPCKEIKIVTKVTDTNITQIKLSRTDNAVELYSSDEKPSKQFEK